MKIKIFAVCAVMVSICSFHTSEGRAQQTEKSETRAPVAEQAVIFDARGSIALAGRLQASATSGGALTAPVRNVRFVIENRSTYFYTYASGYVTFYNAEGVRCGEGLWTLNALAPGEAVEVDAPTLRLTCAPVSWRIVASNLLTRASDVAKPEEGALPESAPLERAAFVPTPRAAVPPLILIVNGATPLPIQPGNPVEIKVGRERVRIVVNVAP